MKVKSKSISYHAFSSPSSKEQGEREILIAYLVLCSSTHLRAPPAQFKMQEESEKMQEESEMIQELEKMPHLHGDLIT